MHRARAAAVRPRPDDWQDERRDQEAFLQIHRTHPTAKGVLDLRAFLKFAERGMQALPIADASSAAPVPLVLPYDADSPAIGAGAGRRRAD
nr:hypothetical protein [Paenibacillus sabuli]